MHDIVDGVHLEGYWLAEAIGHTKIIDDTTALSTHVDWCCLKKEPIVPVSHTHNLKHFAKLASYQLTYLSITSFLNNHTYIFLSPQNKARCFWKLCC